MVNLKFTHFSCCICTFLCSEVLFSSLFVFSFLTHLPFTLSSLAVLFPKGNTNGKLCSHHSYLIRTLIFCFSVLAFHWVSASFLSCFLLFCISPLSSSEAAATVIISNHHLMQGTVFCPPGFGMMAAWDSSGFLCPGFLDYLHSHPTLLTDF